MLPSRGFLPNELLGFLLSAAYCPLVGGLEKGSQRHEATLHPPGSPPALGGFSQNPLADFSTRAVLGTAPFSLAGRVHCCCRALGCHSSPELSCIMFHVAPVPGGMWNETGGCSTSTFPAATTQRRGWGSCCKQQSTGGEQSTALWCCWETLIPCCWVPHRCARLSELPTGGTSVPGGAGDSRSAPVPGGGTPA